MTESEDRELALGHLRAAIELLDRSGDDVAAAHASRAVDEIKCGDLTSRGKFRLNGEPR